MDRKRWANIATEMQKHLDALQAIAERERMEIVSIAVYKSKDSYLYTTATYIDTIGNQFSVERTKKHGAQISFNQDVYARIP